MKRLAPTVSNGRGHETLGGSFNGPLTTTTYRAQTIAVRYSISIEYAAIVASIAFGSAAHG